jgi:hypothetical protein
MIHEDIQAIAADDVKFNSRGIVSVPVVLNVMPSNLTNAILYYRRKRNIIR